MQLLKVKLPHSIQESWPFILLFSLSLCLSLSLSLIHTHTHHTHTRTHTHTHTHHYAYICSKERKHGTAHASAEHVLRTSHIAFEQRPSMLSSEHPDNSYRGFVNVIIILLILANMRIVIQVGPPCPPMLSWSETMVRQLELKHHTHTHAHTQRT